MTNSELKNEIIMELLFSGKVRLNQEIEYEQFLQLYSNYTYLPETFFATILGSIQSFLQMKQNLCKMIILKDFDIYSHELKEKIINELLQHGIISYNMKINYDDFLKILNHYSFLDENALATILDINTWTLQRIKYDKSMNTFVLRKKYFLTEIEEQQVNDLIDKRIIYPGMQINYEFFQSLKLYFGKISNNRLAYILEISSSMLHFLKEGLESPIILKSRKESFILSQRDDIIHQLIDERGAYKLEKINKDRFFELYKGFEFISETDFAFYILGIKYNTFRSLKSDSKNAIILKHIYLFDDYEKERIYKEILETFHLTDGAFITYDKFIEISNNYSDIDDDMLCSILGISWLNFRSMKYNNKKVGIYNGVIKEKMYFIKKHFLEDRFYSKEELEQILHDYNVTLENFICYFINNRRYFYPNDYMEAFNTNGGLYIGKFSCSNEFIENSYDIISKKLKPLICRLERRNFLFQREDILQQCMLYLYKNCGDLERNFSFTPKLFDKIIQRIEKMITGMLVNLYHNRLLEISINDERYFYDSVDKNPVLIDKKEDVSKQAMEMVNYNGGIYEYTILLMEEGYSLEEIIEILLESYPEFDKNNILEMIKKELIERGKIKQKK